MARLTGSLGPRLLRLSWTWWASKPRRRFHASYGGWQCRHAHHTKEAAILCRNRKLRRLGLI
jgi:hypothetical protein